MKKSKEQKRKEAHGRNVIGKISNLCHDFKSTLYNYHYKNWYYPKDERDFKHDLNCHRKALDPLIDMFFLLDDDIRETSLFEHHLPVEACFSSQFNDFTDKEISFFKCINSKQEFSIYQSKVDDSYELFDEFTKIKEGFTYIKCFYAYTFREALEEYNDYLISKQ